MSDLTNIDDKSYAYDELATKYRDFYAPGFRVTVEGTDLLKEGIGISSIKLETSIHKADSFSFVVDNAFDIVKKDFRWLDEYLEIARQIQIDMGYVDKLETVFHGYITAVKIDFSSEESPMVIVEGMDYSFQIMKGVKSRSWQKKKHSDIVRIIAPPSVKNFVIDNTDVTYDVVEQSRATDYQFLYWLADKNNFEFFISGKTMCFRKPHKKTSPVITLVWGKSLFSMFKHIDLADQVGSVVVRSWDPKNKEVIEGESKAAKPLGAFARTGRWFLKKILGEDVVDNFYAQADSGEEAVKEATARADKQAMQLVSGNVVSIGIPEIRAGKYAKLEGVGSKLNGIYYIEEATHTIDESGYMTVFDIGGNAI